MWKSAAVCGLIVLCTVVCSEPIACGAVNNASFGTLESPNYPFTLEQPQICLWTFDVQNASYVYLMIRQADLGPDDVITITDYDETRRYNASIDFNDLLFALSAKNSSVEFNVSGNSNDTLPRRFMASYTTDVKQNRQLTRDNSGVIRSPIVLKPHPSTLVQFEWIITQKPESNVYLSFKHFNVLGGNLTVDNGQSVISLAGHITPNDIIGLSNVKLTFTLTPENLNCSFEVMFSQYEFNCSYTLKVDGPKVVNFPTLHPSDKVKCLVIVESPENSVLSASLALDANAQSFPHALLVINDGGSRYSSNLLVFPTNSRSFAPEVLSTGNRLWIEYMSNAEDRTPEVNVTLSVYNSGSSLVGKGTFNVTEQPGNATLTSNSSAFMLTASSTEQVVVTLTKTNLSSGNEILLYDGPSRVHLLANFTQNSTRFQVPSVDNQMMVVAKNFVGNDSFLASFVSAPKGCNFLSDTSFDSYHLSSIAESTSCFWNIMPSASNDSSVISLTINQLNLKPGMTLTLFDGTQETASIAYTTSSNLSSAITVHVPIVMGARLLVNNTGNTTSDLIVDATYVVLDDCNLEVNVTGTKTVESPLYPNAFPANVHCVLHFTASPFLLFRMEDVHLSDKQPLIFYHNGSVVANASGDGTVEDLILPTPVILQFNTTAFYNATIRERFRMEVSAIEEGGIYTGTVKEFATPGFPKKVENTTRAIWSIRISDQTKIISLTVTTGEITTSASKLQFYNGGSVLASEAVNMSAVNMTNYLSRTNELIVEYSYLMDKTGGTPYKFVYEEYVCKTFCGNKVCLQDTWRCNGVNDCGDNTDELSCAAQPIVNTTVTGVPVATLIAMIFIMFILGVAFAFAAPYVLKRIRSSQGSYQEFRNTADA